MGCGASTQAENAVSAGVDTELEDTGSKAAAKSAASRAEEDEDPMMGLAKRVESKAPWEVMDKVPSDCTIVFVLGAAGSGKSTQCKRLAERLGYTHLSSGDLLREEVARGTALGKWAQSLMKEGKLVPNQVSITLLKKAMLSSQHPVILVDGFPRSMEQVALVEGGLCKCHGVFFFDVPEDVAKARMVSGGMSLEDFDSQYQTFVKETLPFVMDELERAREARELETQHDDDEEEEEEESSYAPFNLS